MRQTAPGVFLLLLSAMAVRTSRTLALCLIAGVMRVDIISIFLGQGFKSGDDIQKFFGNGALT
jgi:hypothetical protein